MRKLLLAAVALGGLTALSVTGAVAQPHERRVEAERPMMHHADYDRGHHQYHHRRWEHHRWHYWD